MKILIAALAALFVLAPLAAQEPPAQELGWCSFQTRGDGPCT